MALHYRNAPHSRTWAIVMTFHDKAKDQFQTSADGRDLSRFIRKHSVHVLHYWDKQAIQSMLDFKMVQLKLEAQEERCSTYRYVHATPSTS